MGFSSEVSALCSLSTTHCLILNILNTFHYFPSAKLCRIVLLCDLYTSRLTEPNIGSFNLEGKAMGFSLELSDFVSVSTKYCLILITLITFYYFPSAKPDRIILYYDQYTSRLTESKTDPFNLEDKPIGCTPEVVIYAI